MFSSPEVATLVHTFIFYILRAVSVVENKVAYAIYRRMNV
jgi:hypothetical protein